MEEPVLYNRKPPLISAEDKNETICVQFISWNWLIYILKLTNDRSTTQFFVY